MKRWRAGALEHLALQLSDRDWAVLHDLYRVRVLTAQQVERLHFHEGSQLTQARRSRRCLQRLHERGIVYRFQRIVGGVRAGSAAHTYGLNSAGQRLLKGDGPAGGRRQRQPWEVSTVFLKHMLAVSELYVRLRETERLHRLNLVAFDAEPQCWRRYNNGATSEIVKPDAYLCVVVGDYEEHRFVEVDLATESRRQLLAKAATYVDYWTTEHEQTKRGVFPQVLFIVPSPERRSQIVDVLSSLPAEQWRLFAVMTLGEAITNLSTPASHEA